MKRALAPKRRRAQTWQIIYMDLMTTMMIYFVILWTLDRGEKTQGISPTVGDQVVREINLPGDVLFAPGQARLSQDGKRVFSDLLAEGADGVLSFDTGGVSKRMLVVHGHTDGDGDKDENFQLGYDRAFSVYKELRSYGEELPDHVVVCTHADNTPKVAVPRQARGGDVAVQDQASRRAAKAKNRRITIEDVLVSRPVEPAATQGSEVLRESR